MSLPVEETGISPLPLGEALTPPPSAWNEELLSDRFPHPLTNPRTSLDEIRSEDFSGDLQPELALRFAGPLSFDIYKLRCRGELDLLEPCLEDFNGADMSASQARRTLGAARFKILFVLSSSHLSNSSASYPNTSIFLSFFIGSPCRERVCQKMRAGFLNENSKRNQPRQPGHAM
jgi:hypothetical protein